MLLKLVIVTLIGLVATQTPDARCPAENQRPPIHLPHETDCTLYYVCHLGNRILMPPCPQGQHFDRATARCRPAAEADCVPGATTSAPGATTTAPGATTTAPGATTTAPGATTTAPGATTTAPGATTLRELFSTFYTFRTVLILS
jgi:Chitin binding Peritrophin-A domain